MIQDLHAHTYYSFCGGDDPEYVIQTAIRSGIQQFGICDHNYGIACQRGGTLYQEREARLQDYQRCVRAYRQHFRLLQEKYREQIQLFSGIEIATNGDNPYSLLPDETNISDFDYCLIEHLDHSSTSQPDLFAFAKRCGCKRVGVAHTDLFAFLERTGQDPEEFLSRMAREHIYWELNVNCDSVHHYREHKYVKRFFQSPEQQELVRSSGLLLSVGFDGHRLQDYAPERISRCCEELERLGLPLVFGEKDVLAL